MIGYVLDTSVAVKWFSEKDEDDLEKALKIREACLSKICRIIVPELLLYEIANALRYNPRFTEEDVGLAIESLLKLGLEIKKFDEAVMKKALALAYRMKITIYDAYFIALAEDSACTRLLQKYTQDIVNLSNKKIQLVILFGSVARSEWTKGSDIDILTVVSEKDKDVQAALNKAKIDVTPLLELMPISTTTGKFIEGFKKKTEFYEELWEDRVVLYNEFLFWQMIKEGGKLYA